MAGMFGKKKKIDLILLTDADMLLLIEKGITVVICHAVHGYEKGNIKYTIVYDLNTELSYLMY